MDLDDVELPPGLKEKRDNTDNSQYCVMASDSSFLSETLRRDAEKVIRFHLMFETDDGEGSHAKRDPVLGRAFIAAYSKDTSYAKTVAAMRATVESYKA